MPKKTIILVFLIFSFPVILATLMHSQWLDWQPNSTRNHGTLIQPVIQWPMGAVADVEDSVVSAETLSGHWHVVYVTDQPCTEPCLEDLYWLRQIRMSQDRHVSEIQLLFVSEPILSQATVASINEISSSFRLIDGEGAQALMMHFPDLQESNRFIMDPMANIILSYRNDQPPDHIRKDLGRLLTWTQTQNILEQN